MGTRVGAAQGTDDGSGTSLAASTTIAVQAGDAIFIWSNYNGAETAATPTDNAAGGSNVYTERSKAVYPSVFAGHWHVAIAKASETLTFTMGLAAARDYRTIHVIVARPAVGTTFVFDAEESAFEPGSSTAATTGAYTVAGVGGFAVLGCAEYAPGITYTPGSGWTEESEVGYSVSAYRALTSETSITGDCTLSAATNWVIASVALKEEAAGGGGDPDLVVPSAPAQRNRRKSGRFL